ncbi:MAG: PEGA domain-containing protein, partial [Deltaproteobacteria bacterium]|nr:PEGA domain-containing protein [Deltaproteobacteria bacterium]
RLYINSPGQTENTLLQQHNAVRHAEATAYIKSNNFEKALSVISTILETGDEQTDATGLMKALKKRRYSRWIVTGLELAVLFLAVFLIAKEEYRETPAGFSARPQSLAQPVLPKETVPAHKPATVARKKVVRQVLNVSPVRQQNNHRNNVRVKNPDAVSNRQQQAVYTGTLELITYPWAMVFIDDKYIGETPRLKNITLSAGEHKIYIMNPYLKPYTGTLTILTDKTITKRIELNGPSP